MGFLALCIFARFLWRARETLVKQVSEIWSIPMLEIGWFWNTVNSSPRRQNGRPFADDIFWHIFLSENVRSWIQMSPKFVPNGPIDNKPALVQLMASNGRSLDRFYWINAWKDLLPKCLGAELLLCQFKEGVLNTASNNTNNANSQPRVKPQAWLAPIWKSLDKWEHYILYYLYQYLWLRHKTLYSEKKVWVISSDTNTVPITSIKLEIWAVTAGMPKRVFTHFYHVCPVFRMPRKCGPEV